MADNQQQPNNKESAIAAFNALKDADVSRHLLTATGEVCQALGVTVKQDVQLYDANTRSPAALVVAIRRLTMVLTAIVNREQVPPAMLLAAFGKQSLESKEPTNEADSH